MGALLKAVGDSLGHAPPAAGRLTGEDFITITARSEIGEPGTIVDWAQGLVPWSRRLNECRFRDHPLFGRYSSLAFLRQPAANHRHVLAVADGEAVAGQTFDQQAARLPEKFRPVSAVEAIATIFAWQRQDPEGKYPDFGWVYFWCSDVIKFEAWPEWYRRFRGITEDHRIALRIDPIQGIIIADFPVSCFKSWLDWVTPNPDDFATIVIGATTVA